MKGEAEMEGQLWKNKLSWSLIPLYFHDEISVLLKEWCANCSLQKFPSTMGYRRGLENLSLILWPDLQSRISFWGCQYTSRFSCVANPASHATQPESCITQKWIKDTLVFEGIKYVMSPQLPPANKKQNMSFVFVLSFFPPFLQAQFGYPLCRG